MLASKPKVPANGFFLSRVLLVLMAFVTVAGCSSNGLTRIKTFEGEMVSEPAILKAPSSIKVKQVNGRPTGNFLIEDLALDYELRPGTNTIVFTHKTIWAKSGVIRAGESSVHVVETGPQQVVLNAQPGEVYLFDVPELANRSDARRFTENFSVAVVSEDGDRVARSEPYRRPSASEAVASGSASAAGQAQSGTGPVGQAALASGASSQAPASAGSSRVETLEALKVLWERASGDEKREFLRWAFD